jgi:xylulokinase
MILLGLDLGSSSVKASLLDSESGQCLGSAFYPKQEMAITAHQAGWAEQDPALWWQNLTAAVKTAVQKAGIDTADIGGIGISYQMHGLVLVDQQHQVLRPAIIWCDSRAVEIGRQAFDEIGGEKCLEHLLNSPGNFTASKLKWVKENEPEIFARIHKAMLPGDYLAMRLTGNINTTVSGLSEGIFWDFNYKQPAKFLLEHYGIDPELLPEPVPTFSVHGEVLADVAAELGLTPGTKVAYRAGDQPNNAFSLNVLKPGEIAATAGTSGVVYGVSDEIKYDPKSRVNTFAHVNHADDAARLGVLLCVNGTGILNSWLKKNVAGPEISYQRMDAMADEVAIGSQGLSILPFGNGAERILQNQDTGAHFCNLNFNIHSQAHLFRAAQEGIVFAFNYGIEIMRGIGINPSVIKAGNANMFLSSIFRDTLAGITGAAIELYDTDGALGAARGAGVGVGCYSSFEEAFANLQVLQMIEPDTSKTKAYSAAYAGWVDNLNRVCQK